MMIREKKAKENRDIRHKKKKSSMMIEEKEEKRSCDKKQTIPLPIPPQS